jgi:hypothetical protein
MKIHSFFKQRKLTILNKTSTNSIVLAIKKANDQGDYETFKHYINNSPLDIIVEVAYKYPDNRLVQRYATEYSQNADAHFLYSNYLVNKAWQARNGGVHKKASTYQLLTFSRFLNAAHFELYKVLQLNPKYLPAFCLLIKIQREKNNKKLAKTIYQQAKKIAPALMDYHLERMTMLTPTWGGSSKKMLDFAQKCAQKDSTGILHGLIPAMHFEYWYSLSNNGAKRYIDSEKVKKEIKQAYLKVENAEFGRGYYQKHQYHLALNYFALLFLLMGEKKRAKIIFNRINGKYTYKPWANMGENPGIVYLEYKKLSECP